jgi:hypothetical protein
MKWRQVVLFEAGGEFSRITYSPENFQWVVPWSVGHHSDDGGSTHL